MNWSVLNLALVLLYACYFGVGLIKAPEEWQKLVRHLPVAERLENKANRKGIVKRLYLAGKEGRRAFELQALNGSVALYKEGNNFLVQEELEGVVGSFYDGEEGKTYTAFVPHALFDYPKKRITGYQAQVQEFDAGSKLVGKAAFSEVECDLNGAMHINLKNIHAELD